MVVQRHNVVISKSGGGVEVYPMKDWLREHPEENPTGRDPGDLTSHQLRAALQRAGWSIRRTETEVILTKPSSEAEASALDQVLGSTDDPGNSDAGELVEAAFALEYQLRDFIADN